MVKQNKTGTRNKILLKNKNQAALKRNRSQLPEINIIIETKATVWV